jgi:hypothetical protein
MTDRSSALRTSITLSRVFVGDAVSRVFVGDTVSRFYIDVALEEARRRVAEPADEMISSSDLVGGERDEGENGKRGDVYRRLSRSELGGAECQSGIVPGVDALAS